MKYPLARTFCALLILACIASGAHAGIQSRQSLDDFSPLFAPLGRGAKIRLERIAVGDREQTLELERFEVWAPNARIDVVGEGGAVTHIAPPNVRYFRGSVAGEPDSLVFLSTGAEQGVAGMIFSNDRRYAVGSTPGEVRRGSRMQREVVISEMDVIDDYETGAGFECGVEGKTMTPPPTASTLREIAMLPIEPHGALSGTGLWSMNLVIDTDFELYGDMGSSSANVTTFVGNVVGASSTVYQRDLRTELLVAYSRVHTTSADPFNIVPGSSGLWNGSTVTYTTGHALAELGDVWHNSPPFPLASRSDVILLSGKSQTAGTAWIGTSCGGDFLCGGGSCGQSLYDGHYGGSYAYCGLNNPSSSIPDPNATNNGVQYGLPASNYWPVLVLTHELGHNVNSQHTHCVGLTAQEKTNWNVTRNFVDECVSTGGSCFSGATSIPAEKGSIMSYCHLSGASQSRYLFGKSTEPTQKIVDTITTFINSRTPASPSINAPASMTAGTSANASINSPIGGQTYSWTVTNGTINGGNTGTTINFTANMNPVTVRARTLSSTGCSATDSVNVTVNSCLPPSITNQPQSASVTQGAGHTLSVTATQSPTTYQWYIGASGNTSTPTGTNSSTLNITVNATASYWVRVSNACGSVDSAAATVTMVPLPFFVDGFEQMQTLPGRWGGHLPSGAATNTVAVTQAARLGPNTSLWGLEVTLQDTDPRNMACVFAAASQGFSNETTLRGSFFINPQGVTFGTAPGAYSFQMIDFLDNVGGGGCAQMIFHLRQDTSNGNYFLNVWHWNQTLNGGAGNWQFSGGGFFALKSPAWRNNRLEFEWRNGNPGHMTMWRTLYTNGAPDPSGTIEIFSADLPGMQNVGINYVFAGMFTSHDPGTSGVLYLDEFSFGR